MWWNFLNGLSWSKIGLLLVPAIMFIFAVIGLITVIKWIW